MNDLANAVSQIPQYRPNGSPRGALNAGGTPGNKGGRGTETEKLRLRSRAAFEKTLNEFERRDLEAADIDELVQIANVAGKYGGLIAKEITVDVVRAKLTQTLRMIRDRLPAEVAEPLVEQLREVWR